MNDSMLLASDLKNADRVIPLYSSGKSLPEMLPLSYGSSSSSPVSNSARSAPSELGSAPTALRISTLEKEYITISAITEMLS